jgi:dTDP-4-dehydrorhamnose reductase
MRYAVIGSNGLFGAEMVRFLQLKGVEVERFNRSDLDLKELTSEQLASHFTAFQVVINAVAYTDVDKAETESFEADVVNGIIAGKLARAASIADAKFMHISTDYVFEGNMGRPVGVNDTMNPQTAYGRSKALGELLVSESGAKYTIFRTAWLYGQHGRCFPKVIQRVLETRATAEVVCDQFGQPTWTRDLAEQVLAYSLVENAPKIVHAVASGKASWSDFAAEVANSLGLRGGVVTSITTSEYPTPAKRPAWSVLDNSSDLVEPIGDWRERWLLAADEVLGSR